MKPRCIVFLDIDGVLAHFGSNEQLDPKCIERLDDLTEAAGAEVILTSSWRDAFGIDETQRRLAAAGARTRIAGAVPCVSNGSRSDEIDAFLVGVGEPLRFVILDDVPVAKHLKPHLVLTDDFVGLTPRDVALASRILSCLGEEQ
jgi:hypothetical protein